MDPLSISMSLMAIVGTAIKTAQGIQRVKDSRKYPAELSTLFAEVADLQYVLQTWHQLSLQRDTNTTIYRGQEEIEARVYAQVQGACDRLAKLQKLLDKKIGQTVNPTLGREVKTFWTNMTNGKNKVEELTDELRDLRNGISNSFVVLSSTTLGQVASSVTEILHKQEAFHTSQRQVVDLITLLSEKAAAAEALQSPPGYSPQDTSAMTVLKPCARKPVNGGLLSSVKDLEIPRSSYSQSCRAFCSCQCHTPSCLYSFRTLAKVVGTLDITHNGIPYLTRPCNQSSCHKRATPSVRISYRFPQAFANRFFLASFTFSDLAGPEMNVKLPRVVDWTSPVWQYATVGNVRAIEQLFRNGIASPWDVSPIGGTLLHYATDHWSPDFCRLLVEAKVDPCSEDIFKSNPVGIAWEQVLSGRMSPNDASIIASLFKDTEYLTTRAFTVTHKIVLGLLSKDLDAELACSTAEINSKDSRGRTPLSWAAARGDEQSVRILLRYNANVHIPDCCGEAPLHYVKNTRCAQLLVQAGAQFDVLNDEGQTALYTACRNVGSASLVDYLIRTGSDVNRSDASQQTPLHAAVSNADARPYVNVLLDAGADINALNNSGDSPLRLAIGNSQYMHILRKMMDMNPDFSGTNNYGMTFSHAIAKCADSQTVQLLTEKMPESLVVDLTTIDITGKTSLNLLEDRLAVLEEKEHKELRDAFEMLVKALESKTVSAEEVSMEVIEKMTVRLHVAELVDDEEESNTEECFFDTVEAL